MTTHRLLTLATFVLAVSGSNATAQNSPAGCSLIDPAQKAQYITYDRISGLPTGIKLILHNNTNCNLLVQTSDTQDRLIQNGKLLDLHYLAANRRKQTLRSHGFGDSVGEYELVGGYTAAFVVPFSFFKQCDDVAVPFTYVWEKDHVGAGFHGGVTHHVYFLRDDLPASLRKGRCS